MSSIMPKIHTHHVAPIFITHGDNNLLIGTHSFLEAKKWLDAGHQVVVSFKGKNIGKMIIGEPIDTDDDIYKLNPSEPYGTVHYAEAQHCFYINLPDELLS